MIVLYVTRLDVPISKEHVFIRDVWQELSQFPYAQCLEVIKTDETVESLNYDASTKTWTASIHGSHFSDSASQVKFFLNIYKRISPDIIHSNMHEGTEIEAAAQLGIPVVTTIHIGSTICPRGGNGLWTKDDQICDGIIGKKCIKCCCDELPFSFFSYLLIRILPTMIKSKLRTFFLKHKTFYFTRLFTIESSLENRKSYITRLKNAHPIAANQQLFDLLCNYGCSPLLLPHGILPRKRLPLPNIEGVIKFYYVGRINHQKGIHVAIDAFKSLDKSKYEFHIIGEGNAGRKNRSYFVSVINKLKSINAFYHGFVDNDGIDDYVKDWHVMIHPAICHEIYGLTISEALSVGRPVIATKCYGSEMQIEDSVNGWLIPTNDSNALRTIIQEIISKPELINAASSKCDTPMKMRDYVGYLNQFYTHILSNERNKS